MQSLFVLMFFCSLVHAQIIRPHPAPRPAPTPNTQTGHQNIPAPAPGPVRTNPTNWNYCGGRPCGFLEGTTTPSGIALDTNWKISIHKFALKNVVHQSWGYSHSERNYHMALFIAQKEQIDIDPDVLFAASFLHDLGGLPPYEIPGVDHGLRSAQVIAPLLEQWGFPLEKINAVKQMVIDHVYTHSIPEDVYSKVFRDADMLDFLGVIGISRLMGASLELDSTPSLSHSVKVIEMMTDTLPGKLSFSFSKKIGQKRVQDARNVMRILKDEALDGVAY